MAEPGGQRFAQQRAARPVEDDYFLAADLLGFSSIVSNLSGPALDKRIGDWVNLVQRIRPVAPGTARRIWNRQARNQPALSDKKGNERRDDGENRRPDEAAAT